METVSRLHRSIGNRRGIVFVFVVIAILVLIGFAALAIDMAHVYVVRNELKDAADAGALAGARVLYINNGTLVNVGANEVARIAAVANLSDKSAVEVNLEDVDRGHWSFEWAKTDPSNAFTADNTNTSPVDLWNISTYDLDTKKDFINAVRVRTHRRDTPVVSFFARVLGFQNFVVEAVSVAYIGFTGSTFPDDVDQPISICRERITDGTGYTCRTGRMISSSSSGGPTGSTSQNSGAWTDFIQSDEGSCGSAPANIIRQYAGCAAEAAPSLIFGSGLEVTNGEVQNAYDRVLSCWQTNSAGGTNPWQLKLPVIRCGDDRSPSGCMELRGVVTVNVLWITRTTPISNAGNVPRTMAGVNDIPAFTCSPSTSTNEECWDQFVHHFNLQDPDGNFLPYVNKALYFLPDCEYQEPTGNTGGENFGVLAKHPVLVQ